MKAEYDFTDAKPVSAVPVLARLQAEKAADRVGTKTCPPYQADSLHSSRREKLVEHVFVGEILRNLWRAGVHEVDILRAETDAAGYDIVIEVGSISRHIQLKSSAHGATTAQQKINVALGTKRSSCVLWVLFNSSTMELGPFLWFGGKPGEPLPDITNFPVAKHTKGNAEGEKAERKNIRVITKGKFTKIPSISGVIEKLFGPLTAQQL